MHTGTQGDDSEVTIPVAYAPPCQVPSYEYDTGEDSEVSIQDAYAPPGQVEKNSRVVQPAPTTRFRRGLGLGHREYPTEAQINGPRSH
jgi:hypothetical protein